jgi:osmotically-inducible protein OsmY
MERAMYFSGTKRSLIICAYLGCVVCGSSGFAARVGAQAVPVTRGAVPDEELRKLVQAALHFDPYFYDAHVTVSVEKGDVLLKGFVFSDWDLLNAMRIARKAAGGRRVVDSLSIETAGPR